MSTFLSRRFRFALILTFAGVTSLNAASTPSPRADRFSARFFRDGGAYGLGQAAFGVEPVAKATSKEEEPSLDEDAKGAPPPAEEIAPAFADLSWNIVSMETYETKPAKHADSRSDWHLDSEFSSDITLKLTDEVTLTSSFGFRWIRFSAQRVLSSDEPFAGLELAWQMNDSWKAILRHESFWDLETGFGREVFAAHVTTARLQYDLPNPNDEPMRWQLYLEAARSLAEPSVHDYYGGAAGFGTAIRLVPQRLRFQIGAGVSFQRYPRFIGEDGATRQGWNTHAACSLVWTPSENVEVSLGMEYMKSAERGQQFHFDEVSVPFAVRLNF
jgi:hypothetical protein